MIQTVLCAKHEEAIETIDITKSSNGSRIYCLTCLEENKKKLEQTCYIQKIPFMVNELQSKKIQEIHNYHDIQIQKLNRIIKLLNTHMDKIIGMYKQLVNMAESLRNQVLDSQAKEQNNYINLLENLDRIKLQQIAELLSGNLQFESDSEKIRELFDIFDQRIQSGLNSLSQLQIEQTQDYRMILKGQLMKTSQLINFDKCHVLACNDEQNVYVGGVGESLVIWEKEGQNLKQQQILNKNAGFMRRISLGSSLIVKMTYEYISAIVIYKTKQIIVVGNSDKKIKLIIKIKGQWECTKEYKDHKGGITNLKLTNNEQYLISTGRDSQIKIWILKQENLECLQTLQNHTNSIFFINLTFNSDLMVTSSNENYFNIFQCNNQQWKHQLKMLTEGKINRVHFTEDLELICQQVNPPRLLFYKLTYKDKSPLQTIIIQEIVLKFPDNDIVQLPILQIGDSIICKNENQILIIRKYRQGKYHIDQEISGQFNCGIVDNKGECLILSNQQNQQLEIYAYY